MKTLVVVFCVLIINGLSGLCTASCNDPISTDSQLFKISPNPASNYLEVKLNMSSVANKDSITKKPLSIQVLIMDQKGMMVYSSTKNNTQFSIFTGGLLNGEYEILCKMGDVNFKQRFQVKH